MGLEQPLASAWLTLEELKARVGPAPLMSTQEDDMLTFLLNAATTRIEAILDRKLIQVTYAAQRFDGTGTPFLSALEYPITAISGIKMHGLAQTVWLPGDADDPATKDVVLLKTRDRLFRLGKWPAGILNIEVVSYTGGYLLADVPKELKQATLVTIRHWWKLRSGRQGLTSKGGGPGSSSQSFVTPDEIPEEALDVLDDFRRTEDPVLPPPRIPPLPSPLYPRT